MKKFKLFIFLSIIFFSYFLFARSSLAATYYIDPTCTTSGDGTTQTCGTHGPFKTWAEVTWTAGNTYAQKGGTTAYEQITVGASGTEGNVITLTSYGTGRATLNGIVTVSDHVLTGWTADDPVAGTYSHSSLSGKAWYEDGVPLLYQTDNDPSSLTAGQVAWESAYKNYYKPTSGTPADHLIQITRDYGVDLGSYPTSRSYITINNLSFTLYTTGIGNTVGSGIPSGTANNNITITNCTFDDVAWGINIMNDDAVSSTFNISNNSISYAGNSIELGSNGSASAYWTDVTIANNTITYCSQKKGTSNLWRVVWGDPAYHYTKWKYDSEGIGTQNLNNANVYGNTITGLCRGIVHYVCAPSSANNNNFYRNYINVAQDGFQWQPEPTATFSNNKAYYNIIVGGQHNDYSGGYADAVFLQNPSTPTGTNYFYNNTVMGTGPSGHGTIAIVAPYGLKNYVIKNNIFHDLGVAWNIIVFGDPSSDLVIDRNLWYPPVGLGALQWNYNGPNINFAAWQALGYDVVPTPSPSDPLFTNGSGNYSLASDFTLQSSSPAKWAGTPVGLATDYAGNPVHNPPSIGAYEYQGGGEGDTTPPSAPTGVRVN